MQNIEVIRLTEKNTGLVAEFLNSAGLSLNSFRYFSSRSIDVIKNHICTLIILYCGKAIGYGHLDRDTDDIWLGVAIGDEYTGKGFGKLLMQKLLEIGKENDIEVIKLTVDRTNTAAQEMYLKFGFQLISENVDYLLFELYLNNSLS